MERKRVGIVVFDGVEILDFCGPYEVFSVTRLPDHDGPEDVSPYDVHLVAEHSTPCTTTGGMIVTPHHDFTTCPPLDLLLVPGGNGTRREQANPAMLAWLRERARAAELVTSVCTGALVLGHAGLLDGRRATTHWEALATMRSALPAVTVDATRHYIRDGDRMTAAGIAAGIDMALRIVADDLGEAVARMSARYMEYPYSTDDTRRVRVDAE
jgi:transcriptional regulator GlxA family with amidase domain